MVFDLKSDESMQRKARFVAGGHMTGESDCLTYASVVSRESIRLAFMLASLNGLEVLQADVEGAYLNANSTEKLFTVCGPEFGEFAGRRAIICRALYGTKSTAASWRAAISKVIKGLGFEMCQANNDVWMSKGSNKASEEVWEYVLVYSDDLLIVARNLGEIAAQIDQHFKLKNGSIKAPESYLGADIGKFTLPDKSEAWFMSSESYVKEAIKNVEGWMKNCAPKGLMWVGLKTKVSETFPSNWKPERGLPTVEGRGSKLVSAADWSSALDGGTWTN